MFFDEEGDREGWYRRERVYVREKEGGGKRREGGKEREREREREREGVGGGSCVNLPGVDAWRLLFCLFLDVSSSLYYLFHLNVK